MRCTVRPGRSTRTSAKLLVCSLVNGVLSFIVVVAVLRKVLAEAGFAADALLAKAQVGLCARTAWTTPPQSTDLVRARKPSRSFAPTPFKLQRTECSGFPRSRLVRPSCIYAAQQSLPCARCICPHWKSVYGADDALIFGQDRLDVVLDLCGGWKPTPVAPSQSAGPVRRWGGYAGKARGWAMVLGGSAAFDEEEVEDNGSAAAYRSEPRSLFASSASGGRAPRASRAARSAVSVPRQQAASGARGRVRLRAKL